MFNDNDLFNVIEHFILMNNTNNKTIFYYIYIIIYKRKKYDYRQNLGQERQKDDCFLLG